MPASAAAPFGGGDFAVKAVRVSSAGRPVGTLAVTPDGVLAFEYADEWLGSGYSISPLSLPLEKRVFVANRYPLDGVFGVFDDSLPGEWGRLLVDRLLRSHGVEPFDVGPLARLAVVGSQGMGALEYEPETRLAASEHCADLDAIAEECARLLASGDADDLDKLFALGGSSGGESPKALIAIEGEEWIVKFPSSMDPPDIGKQEYLIALAAKSCGIDMPEVRLLPSKRSEGYFGVKRFDRASGPAGEQRKVHMISAGALLEASHRAPGLDYHTLMRLTIKLTDSFADVERLYRLMCFNVRVGNRDDHAKNFSFLYDEERGAWRLSSAYDLTSNPGMNGEHATTVNGKGRGIQADDLVAVGTKAGLSNARALAVLDEVWEATAFLRLRR